MNFFLRTFISSVFRYFEKKGESNGALQNDLSLFHEGHGVKSGSEPIEITAWEHCMCLNRLELAASYVFNAPLRAVSSDKSNCLNKSVSGVAIGVFTLLSLGCYGVHAYRFLAKEQHIKNSKHLASAVEGDHTEVVSRLFDARPALKATINEGETPRLLHIAAMRGNKEMIRILKENGANIDAPYQTEAPLVSVCCDPVCQLKLNEKMDMIQFLVDMEASLNPGGRSIIFILMQYPDNSLEDKCMLIRYFLGLNASPNHSHETFASSLLGIVASHWSINPEAVQETVELMLDKGAELKQDGAFEKLLSLEVSSFIRNYIPKKLISVHPVNLDHSFTG